MSLNARRDCEQRVKLKNGFKIILRAIGASEVIGNAKRGF